MPSPRVVIFEDEPLIALEIQQAIEDASGTVCGIFRDGACAKAVAEEIKPDIAIIDLGLLDGDTGAEAARLLNECGCEIIVFSGRTGVDPMLCRMSHKFIGKPLSPELLAEALRPGLREPVTL